MQTTPPTTERRFVERSGRNVRNSHHEDARESMFIFGRGKPTGRSFQMQLAESIRRRVVAESHGSNTPTRAPPKRIPVAPPRLPCATFIQPSPRGTSRLSSLDFSFTENQMVTSRFSKVVGLLTTKRDASNTFFC